jgi:hypothetical protein
VVIFAPVLPAARAVAATVAEEGERAVRLRAAVNPGSAVEVLVTADRDALLDWRGPTGVDVGHDVLQTPQLLAYSTVPVTKGDRAGRARLGGRTMRI